MPDCLNCGRCCHFIVEGKITPCKYLRWEFDGTSKCLIYKDRIDTEIFTKPNKKCGMRHQSKVDFKGCPYNTNKPILPIYNEDI